MSRRPPSMRGTSPQQDGSVRIEWALETDSDEPDEIHVQLTSWEVLTRDKPLAGDARSYDVAAKVVEAYRELLTKLGHRVPHYLEGSVIFAWKGDRAESLESGFSQLLPPAGESGKEKPTDEKPTDEKPTDEKVDPRVPILTIKGRHPKTARHRNHIALEWKAYNFNHAEMRWRHKDASSDHVRELKPKKRTGDVIYEGVFTTDRPLASGATYHFRVRGKNTYAGEGWEFEKFLEVVAAHNFTSVRQFLAASRLPTETSIRQAGLPEAGANARSMRAWLEP